jgi:hypothetical protein
MAKLTKAEAKAHAEAAALLEKDTLTDDERIFFMENWQESAHHVNSTAGAFFTPHGLARDFAIDVTNTGRVIDLCAGIGSLSLAVYWHGYYSRQDSGDTLELVCVELNPEYVEIGRKLLPEATWICGSIFDLPDLGEFDWAISNPPFGNIKTGGEWKGKYTGSDFEFRTIEIASRIARHGTFIIPQMSAGFRLSGAQYYEHSDNERDSFRAPKYQKFQAQTGIRLDAGCGVDTTYYKDEWHGVSPQVEIACADFTELERAELAPMAYVEPERPSRPVAELPIVDGLDFGDWEATA